MENYHSLLKRQLKRNFGANFIVPEEWRSFIDSIDNAYNEFDSDRTMLERSLDISSQELIQSNAETRSIIQLFPDIFLWLDQEGRVLSSKSSGPGTLKWLQTILNAGNVREMQPVHVREAFLKAIRCAIEDKIVSHVDFSITLEGESRYYEARVIPPLSNHILVLIRDNTEKKLAELKLEESEQRFRRLAENARDVIARFEFFPDPHYAFISPAIRELTGFSPEDFYSNFNLGFQIVHPFDRDSFRFSFNLSSLKTGSVIRWRCRNGSYIWVEQRVVPVQDKSGSLIAIESISRDITERIIAEKKIHELYEQERSQRLELEEEAKARGQFIDVLAHELRTPLTPVLVSISILKDLLKDSTDPHLSQLVNSAAKGTNAMVTRLEELLDLARFSRGTFKLNLIPLDIIKILNNSAAQFLPAIEQKHQKLCVKLPSTLPPVLADSDRLEQVIINLLSNAGKYSPENTDIELRAEFSGNREILVEIRDHGIGISFENQNNLFKPYHRVAQDRQSYPGIGLGLAVCKQIIEAHHGRIWIESVINNGSSFKFVLPILIKND